MVHGGVQALKCRGGQVADALRARPPEEDDWTALRRAMDVVTEQYRRDPAGTLALTRLILQTPALCAWHLAPGSLAGARSTCPRSGDQVNRCRSRRV